MNREQFAVELERDQQTREAEIRFLQNIASALSLSEEDRERYRRSLVLMLYAHFEGAVKFSLQTYLRFVNDQGITVAEASSSIAAASLRDVLHALRDPQKKCDLFQRALPDDSALHRLARERDFLEEIPGVLSRVVILPDSLVDTESNLRPIVLRKLLYQVGLDHQMFQAHDPTVHQLLELRNKIAHGESLGGIREEVYGKLRFSTLWIMRDLKAKLRLALDSSSYLRSAA